MKSILCYGDSNTYGLMPDSPDRYPRDVRWTGILQKKLGEDYYVIEEGLSGRTTLWDDPVEEHKNGKKYLQSTSIVIPCSLSAISPSRRSEQSLSPPRLPTLLTSSKAFS